ncbi:MAG TPA: GAF domain-containing protein [Syntrophales bacterium]|nr:GAF domain-containing protein [Syntrophales bacterium]HOM06478.1 GAF domain-containing protein [Syntrophales bacterium]HPQ06260.1 GAF domain-containing protein [Syntrophales bacterium]
MAVKTLYFKIISKISQAFGTTKELDLLLDMIVENIVKVMKVKAACLFLADPEKETFTAVAQTGLSPDYVHAGYGHAEQITPILLKNGYIYYRDAVNDPRLENRESKKKEGIGSILAVASMVRGELIGVLTIYTARIREFSAEEIDFLRILADQGGIAIENARLVAALRRNTKLFSDLAANIASTLDVKTILQTLTEDVAKALDVKGATIRLLNDDRTVLQLAASYGLSERYLNKGPVYAEKSIAEALNGKPVVIADASQDEGVQYREEKKEEGIASILCVPIKAKEEVIGVLRLYSATRRKFTEDDVLLVTALANLGGLAIQNASLYLMLQADLKDMKEAAWTYKSWF